MTDELTIVANGQQIRGWTDISLTRGIENFPSSFSIGLTEKYTDGKDVSIVPGTACEIMLGDDTVLTGYVDVYAPAITDQSHDIRIAGRSKCEDLADCSAVLGTGSQQMLNQTVYQIAVQLAQPFGIDVVNQADDPGKPIVQTVVNLGETPYEIIEKAARWSKLLVYDNPAGQLVLDRVGSTAMASGFQQGVNVQAANLTLRTDQRFSDYFVVWQTMGQQQDVSAALDTPDMNQHGFAEDPGIKALGRFRPHYIVSQLIDAGAAVPDLGQAVADWECNRRWGRSQVITLVTDSWRDKAGNLWQPNALVSVDIPAINMPKDLQWLIASVTYQRNVATGTTAQLVLMPPQAFSIEPVSLTNADADLIQSLRSGQPDPAGATPAGPTTPPAAPNVASTAIKGT